KNPRYQARIKVWTPPASLSIPTKTIVLIPFHFKRGSRIVPKKASGRYFGTTASPAIGFKSSMISAPQLPSVGRAGGGCPETVHECWICGSEGVNPTGGFVLRTYTTRTFLSRAVAKSLWMGGTIFAIWIGS